MVIVYFPNCLYFRVDMLFKVFPTQRPQSQLHDDSYSDSSIPESTTRLRRRRSPIETTSKDTSTDSSSASTSTSPTFSKRVISSINSSGLKGVMLCMLLMSIGAILLAFVTDEEIFSRNSHWSFRFGPQLSYIDGPPPS